MSRIYTPDGEVESTPEQDANIERTIDMGQVNAIQATGREFRHGRPARGNIEEETPDSEMIGHKIPQEPNHEKRVANLQNMLGFVVERGPLLSELANANPGEAGALKIKAKDNQNNIDRSLIQACSACLVRESCEIVGDYEGLREIHPRVKPSKYTEYDSSTETLEEMVARVKPNPNALCSLEDTEAVIIIDDSGEAVLGVSVFDDEGDRAGANLQLRNAHLDKADKALSERNSAKKKAEKSHPERSGRLAEQSNEFFEVYSDEIKLACGLCTEADCALASDPVAWDRAKHYSRSPDAEWEDAVDENGVKHESREQWRKRRNRDPGAPCPPPIKSDDRPKPVPPTPIPDPGLPEAA